jgi:hypothetical protein
VAALKDKKSYYCARTNDLIRKYIKELADKLPNNVVRWYGSKEMKPYRKDIDNIFEWLVVLDMKVHDADASFKKELNKKRNELYGIMSGYYKEREKKELELIQNHDGVTDTGEGLKKLHTIDALEWDYQRRVGNIVLKYVYMVKNETYKRPAWKKYKTNDKQLKRKSAISTRKVKSVMDSLFSSVVDLFVPVTNTYSHRLQEIEQEIKQEHEQAELKAKQEQQEQALQEQETKQSTKQWYWSK